MSECRILYFQGGILKGTSELISGDVVEAAQTASSMHPHLTAEIWVDGRKAAIVRPTHDRPVSFKRARRLVR